MKVRVATWNVHEFIGADGRRDPERVVRAINALNVDVIALQEVPLDRDETVPQTLLHLPDLHGVASAHERMDGVWLGNVVLSRYAISSRRRIDLHYESREPRSALDVVLHTGARPLRVFATHLGLRPAERRFQVQRILSEVDDAHGQVTVLLGDFNEWFLAGRPLRWLHARFGASRALRTFPSRWPVFALDRVWVHPPGALRTLDAPRGGDFSLASDHLPLVAELELPDAL